jgi:hypothetical protein
LGSPARRDTVGGLRTVPTKQSMARCHDMREKSGGIINGGKEMSSTTVRRRGHGAGAHPGAAKQASGREPNAPKPFEYSVQYRGPHGKGPGLCGPQPFVNGGYT